MKRTLQLVLCLFLFVSGIYTYAQTETNINALQNLAEQFNSEFIQQRAEVINYANLHNLPIRFETDSTVYEIQFIDEFGIPQYYKTDNVNAAATSSTNLVNPGGISGFNLDGSGIIVREWDGGSARNTHQEFDSRVTISDGGANHWHSTHVAGTILASGVYAPAKGMAPAAALRSFEWTNDASEMATEAAAGALLSNHSYGYLRGYYYNGTSWIWYGNPTISTQEDYLFGFYDASAQSWDQIAYNAPDYLIVKSAGNDRNEGPGNGTYPNDGPYDCISHQGISKNVLTVGAVDDIPGGYTQPSDVVMSTFSCWGPADDGRIKPDIVTNGVNLTSCYSSSNSAYATASGTSMATPAATGSMALLQQHYYDLNGSYMRSATLKALVIHTADEAGTNDGPDYEYGWGLMNTYTAARKISENELTEVISEQTLANGNSYTRNLTITGEGPLKVTVVWTDLPGTPVLAQLDPTNAMLVNDLDLRITNGSNTYYPWKLNGASPTSAATNNSENNVDNVEVVYIASPVVGEVYTITVDHDGTLSGGLQAFSIIVTGAFDEASPVADFNTLTTSVGVNQVVNLVDLSYLYPTSWHWSFNPGTVDFANGTSATSQNPSVQFTEAGTYEVTLFASNNWGNDTEIKAGFITVNEDISYCAASGGGDEYISSVILGTINNSNTGDDGYADYTNLSTDLVPGNTYSISVTNGNPYIDDDLGIWVDWNQDGTFDPSTENIVCQTNMGSGGSYSFTCPEDANLGNTTLRVRIKYDDTDCGTPCGTTLWGEVEDYTINVSGVPVTWEGNISKNWLDVGNWSNGSIPKISSAITIPTTPIGGNFPEITQGTNAICFDLTIASGASLDLYGNLTIKKDLVNNSGISGLIIKSNENGTGSLITSSDNIPVTVERYLIGGEWHLIGASVDNQTTDAVYFDHSPEVWIKEYLEDADDWGTTITDLELSMPFGKGFAIWVKTGEEATAVFSDQLNAQNFSLNNLAYSGSGYGFNLIANPFTAPIDWDQGHWTRTHLDGNCWVYDPSSGNYKTRNAHGLGSLTNGIIPLSQGFFVKTIASGGNITIPANARVHNSQAFYKSSESESDQSGFPYLVIEVSKENKTDEIWITFNENCTEQIDLGWDVEKMLGETSSPQVFVTQNEMYLSLAALPSLIIERPVSILLNFMAGQEGDQLLRLKNIEKLAVSGILLEDRLTGTFQDLLLNPEYSFQSSPDQDSERFILHFNTQISSLNEQAMSEPFWIYSWDKDVYIINNEQIANATVEIIDMMGRILYQGKLFQSNVNKIELNSSQQYVVVKVTYSGSASVKKVFIR